ncbi:hypothetical protein GQ457_05G022460 [Hibiscus cannabinus]
MSLSTLFTPRSPDRLRVLSSNWTWKRPSIGLSDLFSRQSCCASVSPRPGWISLCVVSPPFSSRVRVRGALSAAFRPRRGLRQGDRLSPFLFLFCSEGLSAALTAAQHEGHLPGVRASKHGPPDILSTYSSVSGQKVNFSKSTAYFSPRTPSAQWVAVHEALGVQEVDDPGIYLGVPLLIGKNKYAAFGHYRDKVDTRVSKWSNLLLSFSGREVLIKSIAQALPQYVMSCYLLPCSLVEEMSRSIRRFWWSGKGSARGWPLVAWDDICLPKTAGGIGFKDVHLFNIALLGKQIWRFLSAPGSLLYRTLRAKYFPDGDLLRESATVRSSFAWKGLHRAMLCLRDGEALPVGSRLRDAGLSDGAYPLCGAGLEDVLHVLRDCPDSSAALRQADFANSLLSTDWATAVDWLGFAASSLSLSSFALLLSILWGLWWCRNTWVHERSLYPLHLVVEDVVLLCLDYASASAPSQVPPAAVDPPRWRPPPAGSVKINVDGAFLPSARLGAIEVVAHDSSGAVLGGFAKPVPVHGPASTVEVSTLYAGLEFAIANDWPSALIEFDADVLVNKLHRPTVDLSLLGDLLAPSRALLAASAGRLRVGFASRLANTAAHALASWSCHNDNVISFSSVCPELISRIVLDDLSSSF